MSEWLARSDDEFFIQSGKWAEVLGSEGNIEEYRWDPAECAATVAKITAWIEAFSNFKEINSSKNRLAKDEAKKAAATAMRAFAASSVRFNPRMDAAARFQLGVVTRDNTLTVHQRPSSQPSVVVENTVNYFEHRLKAENHDTGSTTRPSDAAGVRFAWKVGGERPAAGDDLPKGRFSRRTYLTVTFSEAESGLPVYYAACYENTRGEAGPWSPIVEARIR